MSEMYHTRQNTQVEHGKDAVFPLHSEFLRMAAFPG